MAEAETIAAQPEQSIQWKQSSGRMRELLERMISEHSGKPQEEVSRDIERDKILTAAEAKDYGLIDEVIDRLIEEVRADPRPVARLVEIGVRPELRAALEPVAEGRHVRGVGVVGGQHLHRPGRGPDGPSRGGGPRGRTARPA